MSMIYNKKKIFWLTVDYFYDVDLPIVPEIAKHHNVDWLIFLEYGGKDYNEDEILSTVFPETDNLKVFINKSKLREKDPRRFLFYLKLIKKIKKEKYDFVYINRFEFFYLFPLLYLCRVKNVIYACHDVVPHVGLNSKFHKLNRFVFNRFQNFHVFSQEQYNIFTAKYPSKNVFLARLALKDFGKSETTSPENKIVFTYFGNIRENKGIEYLIEAGNKLHETHHGKFTINILGYTSEWDKYEKLIKYSDSFSLGIRRIENTEIPKIFCASHFIVLPYKDVTQSGVLKIAYNYCTPVICSDFKGFREYVKDGNNGFLFQPMNSDDLYRKMKHVIEYFEDYSQIKQNLKKFVEKNCSINAIVDEYLKFFNNQSKKGKNE